MKISPKYDNNYSLTSSIFVNSNAFYVILFQDFNDNAPVFLSPPSNFTLRVQENETIGAEVVRVHAIDTDIGNTNLHIYG